MAPPLSIHRSCALTACLHLPSQRCRALVHVVDGTSPDPVGDFAAINLELELFNPALKDKPQIVAYNKVRRAGHLGFAPGPTREEGAHTKPARSTRPGRACSTAPLQRPAATHDPATHLRIGPSFC
jgi:hypothetical protein